MLLLDNTTEVQQPTNDAAQDPSPTGNRGGLDEAGVLRREREGLQIANDSMSVLKNDNDHR